MNKILVLVCFLAVSGCASFDLAEPISPESGWPHKVSEVESLQPILKWEPEFDGPADLILLNGAYTSNGYLLGGDQSRPESVLYLESKIIGNEHKVKVTLEPNRSYFWAVRPHSEKDDDEWSNYEYFAFYGIGYAFFVDQPFVFKTPSN